MKAGYETKVLHVNSHLLDRDTERKVRNYQKKLNRMKEILGNDWERILRGNQEVDRIAENALQQFRPIGWIIDTKGNGNFIKMGRFICQDISEVSMSLEARSLMLHKAKYKEAVIRHWEDNRKVDWVMSDVVYRSIRWFNHKGHCTSFKSLFNKWKTRHEVRNNEFMRKIIKDSSKYDSDLCPYCMVREDVFHMLSCEGTNKYLKNVPRKVLKIVNEARKEADKYARNLDFFPAFYGGGKKKDLSSYAVQLQKLQQVDPLIALSGLVPAGLVEALLPVKVPKRKVKIVVERIVSTIAEAVRKKWKGRCAKLYS